MKGGNSGQEDWETMPTRPHKAAQPSLGSPNNNSNPNSTSSKNIRDLRPKIAFDLYFLIP
jgi:hypothetical protein